ncbi:unnamed protein product [Paramecium sonneborni]|uniref:Transmembrane protein n=1 Tax=Paramecium sonneborni TaxID=65129 RepID=A0A8S1R5J5_9CILI|nr:unnamed protein product [Paramecium sonneborni]
MKYFIFIALVTINCYEISLNEVLDCVAKNCDNENLKCIEDSTCNQALKDFNECFSANQQNATYPFQECKGVSNLEYAKLMACYENCDYNLILSEITFAMTIFILQLIN